MDQNFELRAWFVDHWMHAGLVTAIVVIAALPVLWGSADRILLLALTLLPVYMIHQYEEHAHGRFLKDFNATVGKGFPVLSPEAVLVVNVGGVWILYMLTFYLAAYVQLGFALIAAYLMTVNALVHVLGTLATRRYNPGLYTALALFVPWGVGFTALISERIDSALAFNILGLVVALGIHAAILVYAMRRRSQLEAAAHISPAVSRG